MKFKVKAKSQDQILRTKLTRHPLASANPEDAEQWLEDNIKDSKSAIKLIKWLTLYLLFVKKGS